MMYLHGDKEIIDFTPLDMVIPSTEEEVEEEVEVEEDKNGFKKDKMDRPNGGFGRGFSCGNGIEVQQAPIGRLQPDRQEEDWSTPTNVERRENDSERHETPRDPPPPDPPPIEDRLFTDWSSIDSPRERASQHIISARSVGTQYNTD